jgi:hypothetical protein
MNASFASSFGGFQRRIACRLGIACMFVAVVVSPATAAPTPAGVALKRIVTEIRELKRLVFLLKQDERKARTGREQVAKYRGNALLYANGGRHVLHRTGFVALFQKFEQSPGQASLWQMQVPTLEADNFVPEPEESFSGGDVSQLVHYCRQKHLSLRLGSRAQPIIANLVCDAVRQADAQIAVLDERIEHYKAQNIAHTDLVGKLMLCARHCHGCGACYHYGYGCCGSAPALALDHPIAGLNSRAYDTNRSPKNERPGTSDGVATDHRRLKFLTSDEPTHATQPAANQIAGTKDRP